MKNISRTVMLCAVTILCGQKSQSAAFTLTYGGKNAVDVTVNGSQYKVKKEESVPVDTGLTPVTTISWTESVVMGKEGVKDGRNFNADTDSVFEKSYALALPKSVGAVNVGGVFNILGDGAYGYYFGIDSDWNTVKGSVPQIGADRKVW